jgi:acyl-CoA thioester hydrolase
MQIFENTLTVTHEDLDTLNHVNNVRYVQWVQDVAEQHWSIRVTPQILETYFWVMLNHHIHYKGQAVLNDVLLLKTYVLKSEGVTSTRIVEIYHKNSGKLITTSETNWCFMSKATNRPTKITQEIIDLFN